VNSFLPFTSINTSCDENGLHFSVMTSIVGLDVGYDITRNDAVRPGPDDPSVALFEERFRTAVTQSMAPFLICSILAFTLALRLFNPRAPWVTHVVFSLHWIALFLGVGAIVRLLPGGRTHYVALPVFIALVVHLTMSLKQVYGHRWPRSIASGAGLGVAFVLIVAVWIEALNAHARRLAGSL
jgi:hypothetical protein